MTVGSAAKEERRPVGVPAAVGMG